MARKCTDEVRMVRVGGPEWSTPMERAPTNIALLPTQKLMHTLLTHTFYACRHILSLARSLAQQAGRRRQAGRTASERAGQVNGAMIIMTLATMSCGGCHGAAAAAI